MSPLVVIVVGPSERNCLTDLVDVVESCGKAIGSLKVFHADKAIDGVNQLQKALHTCKYVDGVFLHNNFTVKGKEQFSDAIKKFLKDKHPNIPIICWGRVDKGGDLGKDYHYGLNWEPRDGGQPVLHVLQKLKNGDITTEPVKPSKGGSPRASVDHGGRGSPRPSMDRAPASPRASVDYSNGPASPGGSVRRSVDLRMDPNHSAVLRRKSIDAVAPGSPKSRASFDSRGVHHPPSHLRPSMDMMPGGGQAYVMGPNGMMMPAAGGSFGYAPNPNMMMMAQQQQQTPLTMASMGSGGSFSSPIASASQQHFVTPLNPMDAMAGQFGAMGVSGGVGGVLVASPLPASSPTPENGQMIRALADEVTRLKQLVEEKRAREQLQLQQQAGSPGSSVSMGVVNMH